MFVYWNTPLQLNDGTSDRGQYGYYEVHDFGTRGMTGGNIPGFAGRVMVKFIF